MELRRHRLLAPGEGEQQRGYPKGERLITGDNIRHYSPVVHMGMARCS